MHPVEIRGVKYRSLSEAANAFGITVSAVQKARSRGTLDKVGLGRHDVSKPCTVGGREYASQVAAAEDLSVSTWQISNYLKVCHAIKGQNSTPD